MEVDFYLLKIIQIVNKKNVITMYTKIKILLKKIKYIIQFIQYLE